MSTPKKILVICPHPVGIVPGQRLKYEQYFESWKKNGYDITVKPFFNEKTQRVLSVSYTHLTLPTNREV